MPIENAAEKLTYLYFAISKKFVKPLVEDKISMFKMSSIIELIIVKEQIFGHPSGNQMDNRSANASFAMTVAICKIKLKNSVIKIISFSIIIICKLQKCIFF